jgi:hypothetical protein
MVMLDDSGKAALDLVLETTGYYLGVLARPILFGDGAARFETNTERDAELRAIATRLPSGQQPDAYVRLHGVLEDTWDRLDEATTRIAALVSREY